MDTSSSNLTVKDRADAIERLERSFTEESSSARPSSEYIPGYLRSTASATKKYSLKRDSLSSQVDHSNRTKRMRMPNSSLANLRPQRDSNQHISRNLPTRTRESSILSTSSLATNNIASMTTSDEEMIQIGGLYAKYLQYKFLLLNINNHYPHLKSAAMSELAIGYEALKEKKARDDQQQEEESENNLQDFFLQITKVLDQVDIKLKQDDDIDNEKETLNTILDNMNDIKIPMSKVHDNIKMLVECRELMQTIIES